MKRAYLLPLFVTLATLAGGEDDPYTQAKRNVLAVQKAYKEIKADSSPAFQKFKDAIGKGEADFDAIAERYNGVLAKMAFVQDLRHQIDGYNATAASNNAAVDSAIDDADADADRKKRLADINAHKSYTKTTQSVADAQSFVVRADGSIDVVNSTTVGASVTDIRENKASADARAAVQKEAIDAAADKTAAKLATKKMQPVQCTITMDQLKALEDNERTKFKYLMDKQK